MTNKAQQDLLNQLNEYRQTQQLDEIGDFTKAIAKKVGQGVGAIKGAGQKVKGVAQRSAAALGNAYTQGQTGAQKKVAGQDYKAPAAKQTPAATGTQQQTPGKFSQAMSNIGRDLKGVAYDAVAGDGYNYKQGVRSQSDPIKTPNATGTQTPAAGAQTGTPAAGAQTGKRPKTGGKVAGQTSTTASAQKQRDARAAKKGSAIGQGIDQAQAGKQTKPGATAVPGQKAPTQVDKNKDGKDDKSGKPMAPAGKGPTPGAGGAAAQVDANKDGKDDKTGKPISKTAQDIGAKTGVKAGGVALDPSNPEHKGLIAAIEKASPGLTKTVNKLDVGSKGKLLKGLQAA